MPDTFDKDRAAREHQEIMEEAQRIRNGITTDVIDYYWDRLPTSDDDARQQREGIRKYLIIAAERIDDLLKNRL